MAIREDLISLSNDVLRRMVALEASWANSDDSTLSDEDLSTLGANFRHLSEGLTMLADQLDEIAADRSLDA